MHLSLRFMNISTETPEQTETRLKRVIQETDFEVFSGSYVFEEVPLSEFDRLTPDALALVRDDEVWSQLVRSDDETKELFGMFGFHFTPGLDNSGFVGWLATHMKRKLGTELFVVCGQNTRRGGIFDYWGCPYELKDQVKAEISTLRAP